MNDAILKLDMDTIVPKNINIQNVSFNIYGHWIQGKYTKDISIIDSNGEISFIRSPNALSELRIHMLKNNHKYYTIRVNNTDMIIIYYNLFDDTVDYCNSLVLSGESSVENINYILNKVSDNTILNKYLMTKVYLN